MPKIITINCSENENLKSSFAILFRANWWRLLHLRRKGKILVEIITWNSLNHRKFSFYLRKAKKKIFWHFSSRLVYTWEIDRRCRWLFFRAQNKQHIRNLRHILCCRCFPIKIDDWLYSCISKTSGSFETVTRFRRCIRKVVASSLLFISHYICPAISLILNAISCF